MDVSNQPEKRQIPESSENPSGQELIETVISLTGLPEPLVSEELDHILDRAGLSARDERGLTLEELRSAMLAYLETLHADMLASDVLVDDAPAEAPTDPSTTN